MMKTVKEQVVSATEFKAKCLGLLDEIEQRGTSITITRRGKPVAVLAPAKRKAWKSPANSMKGRAKIVGDIVNTDTWKLFDCVNQK
jgi:prevent-host-death family protein